MPEFASRAGRKLDFALKSFKLSPKNLICADFGSSTGGFVDCLLQNDAKKVYSVDTSYGELAWSLRNDPRVVVLERSNAMHVELDEKVDLITVDVGWTKQSKVLPNVRRNLKKDGQIISLIKPHYEADRKMLQKGLLPPEAQEAVLSEVEVDINALGLEICGIKQSPIEGKRRGNKEYLAHLSLACLN